MARKGQGKIKPALYFAVLAVVYLTLFGRMVVLQVWQGPDLRVRAEKERSASIELPALRGRILDRNGKVLAQSVEERRVVVYPWMIGDKPKAASILSKFVDVSEQDILRRLNAGGRERWVIQQALSPEAAVELRRELLLAGPKARLNGIEDQRAVTRIYPLESLGAKLLGSVNAEGQGVAGAEAACQTVLAGKPGRMSAFFDRRGNPIPTRMRQIILPKDGSDIVLTIDSRIQFEAEKALEEQIKSYQAQSGSCIVLDAHTGEILALAEYPSFSPGKLTSRDMDNLAVGSLVHIYEPGSTLKVFTAAAALEKGLENVTSTCTGQIHVGDRVLRCPCSARDRGFGNSVTIERMLQVSCNSEAAKLARILGSATVYEELERFGLLDRLNTPGLGRSAAGLLPDPRKVNWSAVRLANVSFGHGVAISRLNLSSAFGAIANGGQLMRPYLVKEIRSGGQATFTETPKAVRTVVTPDIAARLRGYLRTAVEDGTGRHADVPGIPVAGKTGSAQMLAESGRGYSSGDFVASFAGFAPADKPRVAILVTIEKPRGSTHGGVVASPVVKSVVEKALWYTGDTPPSAKSGSNNPGSGKDLEVRGIGLNG